VPIKHRVSIQVISNSKDLLQIAHLWNALVNKSSKNPFLLSEFAKQFIESTSKGWTPIILIISDNCTILGIAPLKTKKSFLGRYVEFLHPPWCSEFIFDEQYRNTCVRHTLEFLFSTLNCKFASFTLPGSSPNLILLKQQCKLRKIRLKTTPEMGRRIIPIRSTWTEFEALRTRNVRKEFGRMERNLNKTGSWTTMRIEGNDQSDIVEKILNIEEKSWKEKWRTQRGETDWILVSVLRAAQQLTKIEPSFKWNVWFLELKGKTISYVFSIEYKEVAYLVKTSYDEQYKRLYPGIVIQNVAIRELFTERQNKYIDFLSDLPYLQTWTNKCLSRVRVQLTKGAVPTIMQFMYNNTFVGRILSTQDARAGSSRKSGEIQNSTGRSVLRMI
jgi:CelD/BcsL family acetyltransferase involved in cellulose biosynthesis